MSCMEAICIIIYEFDPAFFSFFCLIIIIITVSTADKSLPAAASTLPSPIWTNVIKMSDALTYAMHSLFVQLCLFLGFNQFMCYTRVNKIKKWEWNRDREPSEFSFEKSFQFNTTIQHRHIKWQSMTLSYAFHSFYSSLGWVSNNSFAMAVVHNFFVRLHFLQIKES